MALRMTPEEYFALVEERDAIAEYIPQPLPQPKKEVVREAPKGRVIYVVQKEDPLMKMAIGAVLFLLALLLIIELSKILAMLKEAGR